jgi:acetylornithine deacetylase
MSNLSIDNLQHEAIQLLRALIATPSFSREEDLTAQLLLDFFKKNGVEAKRHLNNIYAFNKYYDPALPTILLNSHHDTVKPNSRFTKDPFSPIIEEDKLFGLGSNDAGGPLVSLIASFLFFHEKKEMKYNLAIAATAEEEISGPGGIEALLPHLGNIDFGIVGEPTLMHMAVAERGLMVLDCIAHGKAGHAARNEGENAIYKAVRDIEWFRLYEFPDVSPLLGAVKMSVTSIEAENKAHNVVPSECRFVVDVRANEYYSFEDIIAVIDKNIFSEVRPRSTRLRSTSIALDHPIVCAGIKEGRAYYGSPTTSDKALMSFPALKMGPGESARSHTADEYIYTSEIREGIQLYIDLLKQVL